MLSNVKERFLTHNNCLLVLRSKKTERLLLKDESTYEFIILRIQ